MDRIQDLILFAAAKASFEIKTIFIHLYCRYVFYVTARELIRVYIRAVRIIQQSCNAMHTNALAPR